MSTHWSNLVHWPKIQMMVDMWLVRPSLDSRAKKTEISECCWLVVLVVRAGEHTETESKMPAGMVLGGDSLTAKTNDDAPVGPKHRNISVNFRESAW